jgi:hypothetical protein
LLVSPSLCLSHTLSPPLQDWDYAPASTASQADLLNLTELNAQLLLTKSFPNIGKVYHKALLRQYKYSDSEGICQWTSSPISGPRINDATDTNTRNGLLGPVIRGVVGDTLLIHFRNQAYTLENFQIKETDLDDDYARHLYFNLVPHGLSYDTPQIVSYEQEALYTWTVDSSSGPTSTDSASAPQFSSRVWMYTSQVHASPDLHTGLVGPIVIVDPRYATSSSDRAHALACDLDDELFLLLGTFVESTSWLLKYNLYTSLAVRDQDSVRYEPEFVSLNTKPSLNGFVFGNLNPSQGMVLKTNSHVRWYVLSIGPSLDTSTSLREVQWSGHQVTLPSSSSSSSSSSSLTVSTPGYTMADMETGEVSGVWLVSCANEPEMESGMTGTYKISSSGSGSSSSLSGGGVAGLVIMSLVLCSCCCCCVLLWRRGTKEGEEGFSLSDCSTHSNEPLTSLPSSAGATGGGGGSTLGDRFQRGGKALLSLFPSSSSSAAAAGPNRQFVISSSEGGGGSSVGEPEEDYVGDTTLTLSDVRDHQLHHQPSFPHQRYQRQLQQGEGGGGGGGGGGGRALYQSQNPLHEAGGGSRQGKFITRDGGGGGRGGQMDRLTELTGVPNLSDNPAFSIDSSEDRL